MRKILFVDDDAAQMKYHVLVLRKEFEVALRNDVERSLEEFREDPSSWAGAIIDVMMPAGKFRESSPTGMDTGWLLLQELRKIRSDFPVLVLTNTRQQDLKKLFRSQQRLLLVDKALIDPEILLAEARKLFTG